MHLRSRLSRVLLLAVVVTVAAISLACETYVGVGVGYGYPGSWGGPWPGGYYGRPYYR